MSSLYAQTARAGTIPDDGTSFPFAPFEELERQLEKLLPTLRIAVVFGGDKSVEGAVLNPTLNPRSWKSYEAVAQDIADALKRIGFRHVDLVPDDMTLVNCFRLKGYHLAWLNTGGVQGFNPMSHAPAMLELMGIPYVGHDPFTVGTLDNKHAFKRDLQCLGIPTAPFMTWHLARGPFRPKVNSRFLRIFKDHWGAFIVKPVSGRASLNVLFVENEADLPDAVAQVYEATENHVLIEAYLEGREYCIAVSGPVVARDGHVTQNSGPFIFSATERVFEPGEKIVTSMDVKPITSDRIRLLDPVKEELEIAELSELARTVYLDFNLESIVRLDVRADSSGRLSILEANPKPDLKRPTSVVTSIVCAGLLAHGMSYDDLILSLLGNRLHFLLVHRRRMIGRIAALLDDRSAARQI